MDIKLAYLESLNLEVTKFQTSKTQKNKYLIQNHREFPVPKIQIEQISEKLKEDILFFKKQHEQYLVENQAVSKNLIAAIKRVILENYPTFKVI